MERDQSTAPLLHMGGPPSCPFQWNGLASNVVLPRRDGFGKVIYEQRPTYGSSAVAPEQHGWLTVCAKRPWLKGIPKLEGSEAKVCERLNQLGKFLVDGGAVQPVTLISEAKPSKGVIKILDDDWLLWVLRAKSIGNVWLLERAARLSRTGHRCVETPRPDVEDELSLAQQESVWIHLRVDAIEKLEKVIADWSAHG